MHPSTRRPENEYVLFLKKNVKADHATKLKVCTDIFDDPSYRKVPITTKNYHRLCLSNLKKGSAV